MLFTYHHLCSKCVSFTEEIKQEMAAYSFRKPFHWFAVLGSLLAYSHSSTFGFVTLFLTLSALILYHAISICHSKGSCPSKTSSCDPYAEEESVDLQDMVRKSLEKEEAEDHGGETMEEKQEEASKVVGKKQPQQQQQQQLQDEVKRSPEVLLSDSESADHTSWSEDSENDSMFSENLSHSTNYSDGSISDEESLIELALPTGQYVESKRSEDEQLWCSGFHQKWPDFKHQNCMEMFNELNEENFIEIDLCMGSIKHPRFENLLVSN